MTSNAALSFNSSPVGSYNEWDPLEEVILGHVNNAAWPDWNLVDSIPVTSETRREVTQLRGHWHAYPSDIKEAAQNALNEFCTILKGEGVIVRRPANYPFNASYATPHWQVKNGFCVANPRDVLLVIGKLFIECPLAHRGRYYELFPYRTLLKEYWQRGANWVAAPKPELLDDLYNPAYCFPEDAPEHFDDNWHDVNPDTLQYITTEVEPVFDAADFVRCGRDIFCQRSQVTNLAGIEWVRRLLEPTYRIHLIPTRCPSAYHIDTTFMPLAPGKILINPNYINPDLLPDILKRWDLLIAPKPRSNSVASTGWMSDWISMNVLMLDERRVVVERDQADLIKALRKWGFEPIPCSFKDYYPFLGSLHCSTLDTVRRGTLQDYS